MLLLRVVEAFERARVDYAVAGGYAVALHGAVRGTVDVDLVIRFEEGQFRAAEKALGGIGLEPRLPVDASEVFHFREEYVERRSLTAWTFVNPQRPPEVVDVLLTDDLCERKTRRIEALGRRIRVVALADLIEMKRAAGRPQDLADVEALEKIAARRRRRR